MSERVVRWVEAGAGAPAVVLEAGFGDGAATWDRVMPLLAPHVRVAAYNRAGLGGSAPAPGPVTIDDQVDDLASVITGLDAGPCVLVGHSWGGLLVQLLAFHRPGLAAGLVLVDPGHEDMADGFPLPVRWGRRVIRAVRSDVPREDAPGFVESLAAIQEMRAAAQSFPDVPVVVLSADRGFRFSGGFRANWTRLQAGLAAVAPQGRHVIVDGSDHHIQRDRPDVVAETILEVAAQVRSRYYET